jgi:hypothetical protein
MEIGAEELRRKMGWRVHFLLEIFGKGSGKILIFAN